MIFPYLSKLIPLLICFFGSNLLFSCAKKHSHPYHLEEEDGGNGGTNSMEIPSAGNGGKDKTGTSTGGSSGTEITEPVGGSGGVEESNSFQYICDWVFEETVTLDEEEALIEWPNVNRQFQNQERVDPDQNGIPGGGENTIRAILNVRQAQGDQALDRIEINVGVASAIITSVYDPEIDPRVNASLTVNALANEPGLVIQIEPGSMPFYPRVGDIVSFDVTAVQQKKINMPLIDGPLEDGTENITFVWREAIQTENWILHGHEENLDFLSTSVDLRQFQPIDSVPEDAPYEIIPENERLQIFFENRVISTTLGFSNNPMWNGNNFFSQYARKLARYPRYSPEKCKANLRHAATKLDTGIATISVFEPEQIEFVDCEPASPPEVTSRKTYLVPTMPGAFVRLTMSRKMNPETLIPNETVSLSKQTGGNVPLPIECISAQQNHIVFYSSELENAEGLAELRWSSEAEDQFGAPMSEETPPETIPIPQNLNRFEKVPFGFTEIKILPSSDQDLGFVELFNQTSQPIALHEKAVAYFKVVKVGANRDIPILSPRDEDPIPSPEIPRAIKENVWTLPLSREPYFLPPYSFMIIWLGTEEELPLLNDVPEHTYQVFLPEEYEKPEAQGAIVLLPLEDQRDQSFLDDVAWFMEREDLGDSWTISYEDQDSIVFAGRHDYSFSPRSLDRSCAVRTIPILEYHSPFNDQLSFGVERSCETSFPTPGLPPYAESSHP